MNKYALKCWKTVKTFELKQKDEISLNGIVTKVEKNQMYGARLNPKHFNNRQSAGKTQIE